MSMRGSLGMLDGRMAAPEGGTDRCRRAAEAAAFAALAGELRALRDGGHPDPEAAMARADGLWRAVLLACGAEGSLPDSLRQGVARLALAMLVELDRPAPDLALMINITETLQAGLTDLH